MTAGSVRRHIWIATGTAGLGLAVLVVFWRPAAAQTAGPQATGRGSDFENGRLQFHRTCAQCHGRNMVNSGTTVYDLRNFPIDQPERFIHSLTNGKGDMPSFRDALSSEQMRWIWTYVSNRGTPP